MGGDSPPKLKTGQQHLIGQYILVSLFEPARQGRCRQRSTGKMREEDPAPRARRLGSESCRVRYVRWMPRVSKRDVSDASRETIKS